PEAVADRELRHVREEVRALRGKLDLAINSIHNAAVQIGSAVRGPKLTLEDGRGDLVASLTTLPHRLPLVHYAIESIFAQTIRPGKVILWLGKDTPPALITAELRALMERGLEIRYVEGVGPHTKLLYALKEFQDKCIVSFDDDILYPINAVQSLWDQHCHFPAAVIANWARELAFGKDGKVLGIRAGRLLTP